MNYYGRFYRPQLHPLLVRDHKMLRIERVKYPAGLRRIASGRILEDILADEEEHADDIVGLLGA